MVMDSCALLELRAKTPIGDLLRELEVVVVAAALASEFLSTATRVATLV
jgi:hypothetical protein